ncbi:hypothetical protein RUM43_008358 [Polyplax serrata]|uniref:F-BAR domain-containing protein n=1 Tax=Polyplax serrata TaxID=468196 RepID=A0AAN8SAC7_POLSC
MVSVKLKRQNLPFSEVSEFTESLARIYEQHAEEMQLLVSNFRKKNSEFRKEKPASNSSLFHSWETFLQEVEIDSQAHSEIASVLERQISRPLLEKSFFRKIQSRKVFSHRDSYENVIKQAEEKLSKTRLEYKTAYLAYMNGPSTQTLANYISCHNEYVGQLHFTNGMLSQYHSETLPSILQEVEDIYNDLCVKISDSILQVAEMISSRAHEQVKRYDGLTCQCKSVQGRSDLSNLVRSVVIPSNHPPVRRHFAAPQPPAPQSEGPTQETSASSNLPPSLKNEIVLDRLTGCQVRDKFESAKKESSELEMQAKQLSDALHTLSRVQQRSIDSNLFNKVNELQEDISVKQHELNLALIRLAGVKAQKELLSNKAESAEAVRERKMSSSSTGSMKSKWMKAFKSLKTPPASEAAGNKDGNDKILITALSVSDQISNLLIDYMRI